MMARGRSFFGSFASPPSWAACSKPSSEKTMPPAGMATKIDFSSDPLTKKPPPAEKLPEWKLVIIKTMTARMGSPTFQSVRVLLTRASQETPMRFTATKKIIRMTATTMPDAVSDPDEL